MRVLTTAEKNAIDVHRVRMAFMVEFRFPTGDVRFTTAAYTQTWNGLEWLGAGGMLELDLPQEDSSLEAHACTISLSGLDPAVISLALNEPLENSRCTIWVAHYDPDTNLPIGTGYQFHRGTVGQIRILPPSSNEAT